jgi:hypothetical protein
MGVLLQVEVQVEEKSIELEILGGQLDTDLLPLFLELQ